MLVRGLGRVRLVLGRSFLGKDDTMALALASVLSGEDGGRGEDWACGGDRINDV